MNKFWLFNCVFFCWGWSTSLAHFIQADEYAIRNQIIIRLHQTITESNFQLPKDTKLKATLSNQLNIYLLEKQIDFTHDDLSFLSNQNAVMLLQYNHKVSQRSAPNDPLFGEQWHLQNTGQQSGLSGADIQATDAWDLLPNITTALGDTIVIAIIEDPMDLFHEDINYFFNHNEIDSNAIDDDSNGYIDDFRGWNAFNNTGNPYNGFIAHGIHVIGTAAAIANNSIGVSGVAPAFKVMPIAGSTSDEATVVIAYDYVLAMRKLYDATNGTKGAFIVSTNASFGVGSFGANPIDYPIWCSMYDSLGKRGILSAVASPNSNVNVDDVNDVPSACSSDFMVSVTATNRQDNKVTSAAFGINTIDIGAPGTSIYATYPTVSNSYGLSSGTSMSTPQVSASMAAMYAVACSQFIAAYKAKPDSMALVMKNFLLKGTERINGMNNRVSSNGRLNLYRAFRNVQSFDCSSCNFDVEIVKTEIDCADSTSGAISVNSSSPLQYSWSTGDTTASISSLGEGEYSLTISNGSCTQTHYFFFDKPQPIIVSGITIIPISGSNPGNFIINANAGNDQLLFALDSGAFQTLATFASFDYGLHHLYIKNQYGCVLDTTVFLGFYNGVGELPLATVVSIYPNPASGKAIIDFAIVEGEKEISIVDLQGRKIADTISTNEMKYNLDLADIKTGVYFVKINTNRGELVKRLSAVE